MAHRGAVVFTKPRRRSILQSSAARRGEFPAICACLCGLRPFPVLLFSRQRCFYLRARNTVGLAAMLYIQLSWAIRSTTFVPAGSSGSLASICAKHLVDDVARPVHGGCILEGIGFPPDGEFTGYGVAEP